MAVFIIKSTELRHEAARMLQGLHAGHSFVLMHYNDAVGYISPDIPEKILAKVVQKDKGEGFKRLG